MYNSATGRRSRLTSGLKTMNPSQRTGNSNFKVSAGKKRSVVGARNLAMACHCFKVVLKLKGFFNCASFGYIWTN